MKGKRHLALNVRIWDGIMLKSHTELHLKLVRGIIWDVQYDDSHFNLISAAFGNTCSTGRCICIECRPYHLQHVQAENLISLDSQGERTAMLDADHSSNGQIFTTRQDSHFCTSIHTMHSTSA